MTDQCNCEQALQLKKELKECRYKITMLARRVHKYCTEDGYGIAYLADRIAPIAAKILGKE